MLLMNARVFPAILLVRKAEGGAIRRHDHFLWRTGRELTEPAVYLFEEENIFHSKLDGLLGLIATCLPRILSDSEQEIEGDEDEVSNCFRPR